MKSRIREEEEPTIFPYRGNPVFAYLNNIIHDYLPHELMKRYLKIVEDDHQLKIKLHPAEEFAIFTHNKKKSELLFSAKTNSAGPGYHLFLARLLARIEDEFELKWQYLEKDAERTDTGLAKHLNLFMVQEYMLSWLHSSAKELISMKQIDGGVSVCMPKGYGVVGDYFVMSPLGYWDRTWFEELAAEKPNRLRNYGHTFFPWWEDEYNAEFWLNWGMSYAWTLLPWHSPVTPEEQQEYQVVLDCFAEAKTLDPDIGLPEKEISEIEGFLHSDDRNKTPSETGIGFNRRLVRKPLLMRWNIVIPGYYYSKIEEEKRKVTYWFGDRKIVSTLHNQEKEDFSIPAPPPKSEKVLHMSKGPIQGWAKVISPSEIETSLGLQWSLDGYLMLDDFVCNTRFFFQDPNDKQWAIDTWRTIFHPLSIKKVKDRQKTSRFRFF